MLENIKSTNELSGFYVIYYGACNLEKPGIFGLAHLMEHLVCQSFDHLQDKFDEQGISWNAYTSSSEIVFYWTGLEENLSKYRDDILALLSDFKVTEEKYENEKNIVIQEYMDAFNSQEESHYLNLCRKEFNFYGPIGLLEDLKSLTYKDCKDFFTLQYSKPSKVLNISSVEMKLEDKKDFKDFNNFTSNPFTYEMKKNDSVKLEKLNTYDGKRSIICFSEAIDNLDDIPKIQMIIQLLSSGLNSPLYQEIREKKGLVYFIQNWLDRTGDKGRIFFSSLTTEENVEKFKDSLYEVLNDPEKYLTEKRFNIIKNKMRISIKKSKINAHVNTNKYIQPKEWVLENHLEDLTYDNCMEVYKEYFNTDKLKFTTDKEY